MLGWVSAKLCFRAPVYYAVGTLVHESGQEMSLFSGLLGAAKNCCRKSPGTH